MIVANLNAQIFVLFFGYHSDISECQTAIVPPPSIERSESIGVRPYFNAPGILYAYCKNDARR